MNSLFSPSGVDAVRRLAGCWSLLAFDLDGTLAPLGARPEEASVPPRMAAQLRELTTLWPVAVITERTVDDATPRLGFTPHYLFADPGVATATLDKGDALIKLMRACGASRALVVGDDVHDESAFAKLPWDSVSVRIGPTDLPTQARYRLEMQSQVEPLLHLLLGLRRC